MKNNFIKKYVLISGIISIILILVIFNKNNNEVDNSAPKNTIFYSEYTSLNGKKNSDTGIEYLEVKISENNIYEYLKEEDVDKIFKEKTTILLIGSPTSNYTRSIITILDDVATSYGIEKIYYYNPQKEASILYLENYEIIKDKDSSSIYKKIVEYLNDYLEDLILVDENNKKYNTKEKIFDLPSVLFVKDGEIIAYEVGTIKDKVANEPLTETEKEIIKERYIKSLEKISQTCDDKC